MLLEAGLTHIALAGSSPELPSYPIIGTTPLPYNQEAVMPEVTGFNVAQAAEAYSAVAGIIAGFAFAVLVWMIDRLDSSDNSEGERTLITHALAFLALAFVANVFVAFLWALISGETDLATNRPGILSFIAGLNFSFLAPMTMEAMTFLVAVTNARRVVGLFRRIFFASVLIALAYQWTSTIGLLQTQARNTHVFEENTPFLLGLATLTYLILIVGGVISGRGSSQRFGLNSEQSFSRFIWVLLFAIFATAIGFGTISVISSDIVVASWIIAAANLSWSILMAWAIIFLPAETAGS
jgi:hypothetical protein